MFEWSPAAPRNFIVTGREGMQVWALQEGLVSKPCRDQALPAFPGLPRKPPYRMHNL